MVAISTINDAAAAASVISKITPRDRCACHPSTNAAQIPSPNPVYPQILKAERTQLLKGALKLLIIEKP